MIDLGADAERLKLRAMENRDGIRDIVGLLHLHEFVHEGREGSAILEMNGDDRAAAGDVIRGLNALDDGVGSASGGQRTGFGVLVRIELPPGVVQQVDEETARIPHLNLPAVERDGKMRAERVEGGLIVARADDEEVSVGAVMQGIGAGHSDAQAGETGLAAEVAHEGDEGLDLLLGGRERQHYRGFAQIGNAREGEAGVREELEIGHGSPVGIITQIEV